MRFNSTFDSPPIRVIPPGIYVLGGVVQINVDGGQLHIRAGAFDDRPEIRLVKADRPRRIVILGRSGSISWMATRWLYDVGCAITQIDYDTTVLLANTPQGLDLPRLRRAQALAMHSPAGLEIVRSLISEKVSGQAGVLSRMLHDEGTALELQKLLDRLWKANSTATIRTLESQASAHYWRSWATVPMLFARADERKVPPRWKSFGNRASPLTGAPRKAGNPANAILNFQYSLLAAETQIAVITMGLDPGIGILHADQPARASFTYDVMEPARPAVDAWLIGLLRERRFSKRDFCETSEGRIAMTQHLVRELVVSTIPLWTNVVAPIVERAAKDLLKRKSRARLPEEIPTKLTESRRSRRRLDVAHQATRKGAALADKRRSSSCLQCGKPAQPESRYCSQACLLAYQREVLVPGFTEKGTAALRVLRASRADPAHGGKAAQKRGRSNAKRARERAEWEKLGLDIDSERAQFVAEIQPKLQGLTVKQIENATGLSLRYALLIRDGRYIPHPVHYAALAALVSAQVGWAGPIHASPGRHVQAESS